MCFTKVHTVLRPCAHGGCTTKIVLDHTMRPVCKGPNQEDIFVDLDADCETGWETQWRTQEVVPIQENGPVFSMPRTKKTLNKAKEKVEAHLCTPHVKEWFLRMEQTLTQSKKLKEDVIDGGSDEEVEKSSSTPRTRSGPREGRESLRRPERRTVAQQLKELRELREEAEDDQEVEEVERPPGKPKTRLGPQMGRKAAVKKPPQESGGMLLDWPLDPESVTNRRRDAQLASMARLSEEPAWRTAELATLNEQETGEYQRFLRDMGQTYADRWLRRLRRYRNERSQ